MDDPRMAALDLPPRRRCLPVRSPASMADISGGLAATACRPHPPAGQEGSGPLVAFARSDLSVRWDSGYASLLEFAEA